jgi:hypothetical protein
MTDIDDHALNLWIPCPGVAARYGQPPGFVAVPIGEHETLIGAGEAQSTDVGAVHFWEIGDCSHGPDPAPPAPPAPLPPPAPRRRATKE